MKLCAECKHAEQKQKRKLVRWCKVLNDLCLNARSENKDCGPDGKLWEKK